MLPPVGFNPVTPVTFAARKPQPQFGVSSRTETAAMIAGGLVLGCVVGWLQNKADAAQGKPTLQDTWKGVQQKLQQKSNKVHPLDKPVVGAPSLTLRTNKDGSMTITHGDHRFDVDPKDCEHGAMLDDGKGHWIVFQHGTDEEGREIIKVDPVTRDGK